MAQLFANNANTRLAVGISNVALSLQVTAGHGLMFPTPTGGDYFLVTLSKIASGIESAIEIVKVTAKTTDTFTIVRAQEGTTALTYVLDDYVQLRMTAATSTTVEAHVNNVANPHVTTKAQVGLGSVDNTTDLGKPISTATQSALDLKAPLANPTFTGTVGGVTKTHVGLANVDNTSDANKPVSTLQASADATVASNAASDATTKANAAAAASVPIAHAGAGGTAHANVVAAGAAGFMTGADKTKLDGITTGANLYVHPTGDGNLHVPATSTTNDAKVLTAGATAGSFSWVLPTQLSSTTPAALAAAGTVGVGTTSARADHVHAFPTAANVGAAPAAHVGTGTVSAHPNVVAGGNSGFMTGADKTKLDGIAEGGGVYTLPVATAGVLGGVKTGTNVAIDGLGVISVAGVNIGQGTNTATAVLLTSSTGTGTTIAGASQTIAGVMLAADKTKLDNITVSGTNTGDETTATIKTKLGISTLSGSNTGDQVIPVAASILPAALGVSAVGTGTAFARDDHVHTLPSLATLGAQPAGTYVTGTGSATGTNTGDETGAGIRTKLGITTLSGSNTGDQVIPTTLPANDVYAWAKASTKPAYTAAEVGAIATGGTAGNVSGTVAIGNGGTGATTAAAARTNLGLGSAATMNQSEVYSSGNPNGYINGTGSTTGSSGSCTGNAATASNLLTGAMVAGNVILTGANYNSYSPGLGGAGASGTWGINVTGSSGSCTGIAAQANALTGTNSYWMANAYIAASCGADTLSATTSIITSGYISATGNITAYSDESLKKNWRDLPSTFVYDLSKVKSGIYDRIDKELTQVGVSAQSLAEVMPDAVIQDESGLLSVAYGNAAMVAVIELAKELVVLKERIAFLEGRAA